MARNRQRGSALIMSMIVVLVVTLISVGIIRFASREVAGSTAAARRASLVACADAAGKLLLARFRAQGQNPTSIAPLDTSLDLPGRTTGNMQAVGGHYDTSNVAVVQVVALPGNATGSDDPTQGWDVTNRLIVPGSGTPTNLKVVVHCKEGGDPNDPASGRQLELELGIRFGI